MTSRTRQDLCSRAPARRGPHLVLAVLWSGLASCVDPIPPGTVTVPPAPLPGSIAGVVRDSCHPESAGIPHAIVYARGTVENGFSITKSTSTDRDGRFKLQDLEIGGWQVTVVAPEKEFEAALASVTLSAGQGARLDIYLTPTPETTGQIPKAQVDILFVVDNSNSMEEEQQSLVAAFPTFIDALVQTGAALDLHLGVVTTDLGAGNYSLPSCETPGGDGGMLQNSGRVAGCLPPSDRWISLDSSSGKTNVPNPKQIDGPTLVKNAFQCIAPVGVGGCGFEQPLEAMRRALDPAKNVNPGFRRNDAFLAVVLLTDEDDCSAQRTELFDPAQQGPSDRLGPLTSFRCTEFGISCDKNGREPGPRKNCQPGFDWLYQTDDYVSFLKSLAPPARVYFGTIAGSTEPFEVGTEGGNPVLKPSCQSAQGTAVPAVRLKAVVDGLAPNSSFDGVCTSGFWATLPAMGSRIINAALKTCSR